MVGFGLWGLNRAGEKWIDSGCMFMVEPKGFADGLDEVVHVRKREPKITVLVIWGCHNQLL